MTKFGVEIEFIDSRNMVHVFLERAQGIEGISCRQNICGYHSGDYSAWKIEYDCSVAGGYELVSPILDTETDGFEQIKKMCSLLIDIGASINRTCGLHVHLSLPHLNCAWMKNILKRYADNTNTIDAFMPASRRSESCWADQYCAPVSMVVENNHFNRARTINALVNNTGRRFVTVNITNYPRLETIEFRQHSGTLNATKIKNWVTFLIAFVEASRPIESSTYRSRRLRPARTTSKRARLLRMLQEANGARVSLNCIMSTIGFLTSASVESTISQLRREGHDIIRQRNQIGRPAFSAAPSWVYRGQTTVPCGRAQQSTDVDTVLADIWHNVPADVQAYYQERITELSG